MDAQDQQPAARRREITSPWRLRTRFSLLLAGLFIAIGAVFYISHRETVSERRDAEVENVGAIAWTVAAVVDGFTTDLDSFAATAAASLGPGSDNLTQENVGPLLRTIADNYSLLRAVFITDTNGVVVATQDGENVGFSVADRDYIKALQAGADGAWSGSLSGLQSGQTTVANARVLRNPDGVASAYLVFAFYPQALIDRIPADLPQDGNLSIIDENGLLLLQTNAQADEQTNVSDADVFQRARQGEVVVVKGESTNAEPGERYGAYVPAGNTGWVVGFTRPASAIDGPLNDRFERDFLLISAVLALSFGFMLFFVSRLSQPLVNLARAASDIALGNRPVMPLASSDADVREVEAAMEVMSRAVAERETRLLQQARVLETLSRVGDVLATELNFATATKAVTDAAADLTGADAAILYQRTPTGVSAISKSGPITEISAANLDAPVRQALEGQPLYMRDCTNGSSPAITGTVPGMESEPVTICSALALPVQSLGEVSGALLLLHREKDAFDEEKQSLAIGLSQRGAIVLENARLYSEGQRIQEQLRIANAQKDEFLGVVSHELRTPITTIYGGARLLHSRRANLDENSFQEMLASIEEEAERMYRLIEDLLAIARADLGEMIATEPTALGPLLERLVRQFNNRRPSRKINLRLEEGLPPALAEASYVQQVVTNLLSNADKYADADTEIDVECCKQEDDVVIKVLDRGPGVPADEVGQIFDSFFRSKSTSRQASGKGLGLTVCKRLVETMSGTIWANNRPGGGLEVGFSLPISGEWIT